MEHSVIIIANSIEPNHQFLTQQAIDSIRKSNSKKLQQEIILVETGKSHEYDGVDKQLVYIQGSFNYNRSLNYGIKRSSGDYITMCNNDLIFSKDWAYEVIDAMKRFEAESASSFSPNKCGYKTPFTVNSPVSAGYRLGFEMQAWCTTFTRSLYTTIGGLSEDVDFWYSDNIYVEQLREHGYKHILVPQSVVTHLCSKTLDTLKDKHAKSDMTVKQKIKFQSYKNNIAKKTFKSLQGKK